MVGGDHDHRDRGDRVERREHLRPHVLRSRGTSAHAHHSAHAQCTLGIAANWFEILLTAPELNDQNAGSFGQRVDEAVVAVLACEPSRSRGGISGKSAKPMSASAVATRERVAPAAGSRRSTAGRGRSSRRR